ncbi:hypothetical protein ACFQI7_06775 [Paenibacillus allorhizosphaerae]|uniref:SPW repeat protein n=1 Tax=Paenibacillus allorhizosphaerae TaxID=2849866 RepID=A0ABN7TJ37_9BACL|nr:hypothetical protein [Paenibacillus allorhizosphaerae]CAG7635733.1 hypothetical protein PAECIP111802_02173 [Paenibacillus allorhizosphaerae]
MSKLTSFPILSALIGVLFLLSSFWIEMPGPSAVRSSLVGGLILAFSSALSYGKSGWGSIFHWISLICSVWFIMFPIVYSLDFILTAAYMLLAITSVMLNYYAMEHEEE